MDGFCDHFAGVSDPRAANARHDFLEVIFIALAAVLCGAQDCTDMALFAQAKLDLLRPVLKLKHGPPSHDTFSRMKAKRRPMGRPCRITENGKRIIVAAVAPPNTTTMACSDA